MPKPETIAVAMSGGVDSSTVAAILAHGGEIVVGLTLQLWDQTRLAGKHGIPDAPKAGRCCSLDDIYDARRVAEHLKIPYYVVNQQERFEADVVRPFVIDAIVIERHLVPHHSELPSCVAVVLALDSEGAPLGAHLDDDLHSNPSATSV